MFGVHGLVCCLTGLLQQSSFRLEALGFKTTLPNLDPQHRDLQKGLRTFMKKPQTLNPEVLRQLLL